jgi:Uri superfamily endonuclease
MKDIVYDVQKGHTLYAVFLELKEWNTIEIGKLGTFSFAPGVYVYVGSAKKNMEKRLARHVQIDKKKRWHLDYLRPYCQITKIISYETSIGECGLASKFKKKGKVCVPRFGASDCKCGGHLIFLGEM